MENQYKTFDELTDEYLDKIDQIYLSGNPTKRHKRMFGLLKSFVGEVQEMTGSTRVSLGQMETICSRYSEVVVDYENRFARLMKKAVDETPRGRFDRPPQVQIPISKIGGLLNNFLLDLKLMETENDPPDRDPRYTNETVIGDLFDQVMWWKHEILSERSGPGSQYVKWEDLEEMLVEIMDKKEQENGKN